MKSQLQGFVGKHQRHGTRIMNGLKVYIITDESYQLFTKKCHALDDAIKIVSQKLPHAFSKIPLLTVYMGKNLRVSCEPENTNIFPELFLGDAIFEGKGSGEERVADRIYDDHHKCILSPSRLLAECKGNYQTTRNTARAIAIIVGKLSQIIYARNPTSITSSHTYWKKRFNYTSNISPYNCLEVSTHCLYESNYTVFLEEVFTGLVFGKIYSEDVLSIYKEYGGLPVMGPNWARIDPQGSGVTATHL